MTDPYTGRTTDETAEAEFVRWFESVQGQRVGMPFNGPQIDSEPSSATPEGPSNPNPGYDPSAGRGGRVRTAADDIQEYTDRLRDYLGVQRRDRMVKNADFMVSAQQLSN